MITAEQVAELRPSLEQIWAWGMPCAPLDKIEALKLAIPNICDLIATQAARIAELEAWQGEVMTSQSFISFGPGSTEYIRRPTLPETK